LIEIFQGEFQLSNCYIKGQECPLINDCPIRKEVEKVQKELINDLSSISLKVLITKNSFLGNEKYNKE
jgi:DNA-binding IscR family transcriptional regulator